MYQIIKQFKIQNPYSIVFENIIFEIFQWKNLKSRDVIVKPEWGQYLYEKSILFYGSSY